MVKYIYWYTPILRSVLLAEKESLKNERELKNKEQTKLVKLSSKSIELRSISAIWDNDETKKILKKFGISTRPGPHLY